MSNVLDEIVEPWPGVVSVLESPKRSAVLAIDLGTSGIRAGLFDECGRELAGSEIRKDHRPDVSPSPGVFDPDTLFEQLALTLHDVCGRLDESNTHVDLIAISCFWHSLIGLDDRFYQTTPLLAWGDPRAAAATNQLRLELDEEKYHARTGCRFHQSYWPAKLRRLRDEEPAAFQRTKHWLSFSDNVTEVFFDDQSTSVSIASGTGLMNQRTCEWDGELLRSLDIAPEKLPKIAPADHPFLKLSQSSKSLWPQLSEARVVPVVADGAANSIGSGCHSTDRVSLMIGTSGAMRVCFKGEPPARVPPELWCYRANRERVLLGGALSDGGGLISWLKESLLPDEPAATLEAELDLMKADNHGLTVLPFWAGERSTGWNPKARGVILGLASQTDPSEIVRAAMEGIAYRFSAIWNALEPFAPDAKLIGSGGALRASPTWAQILADVLGRPVYVSETPEASMRGAALLALEAAGKIESIEKLSATVSIPDETVFEPNMSNHVRYQAARERQERFYQQLFC
ncbi:MAG TPA: gluconokinase [Pyrinomonadaceae bacterium]|nr:gluconokinase [Pyrinomonadaceae bacterium]